MNLVLPIPSVELGPQWAIELNAAMGQVSTHNHQPGNGVQITPAGLNISSDLSFLQNNATNLRTSRFYPQASAITASSPDLGCIYVAGVDLYYNDGNGNQIQITSGGSVTGATGTITGLPSGTASASFQSGSGTFVWDQATSTPANMDAGTYILRYPGSYSSPSGNYIALEAPSTLATGFAITFPATLPGAQTALQLGTGGAIVVSNTFVSPIAVGSSTLADSSGNLVTPNNVQLGSGEAYLSAVNSNTLAVSDSSLSRSLSIATGSVTSDVGFVIVRGVINGNGTIAVGEGFTSHRNSLGNYTITFSTAFSDSPAMVATAQTGGGTFPGVQASASSGSASVLINQGGEDYAFNFIAIGHR